MQSFINRHLPTESVSSSSILHGGDLNESVLINLNNGRLLVARYQLSPSPWLPTVGGQVTAMNLAAQQGIIVPKVVAFDDEGMIYEYIHGRPLGAGKPITKLQPSKHSESPQQAYEAGKQYGLLHKLHGSGIGVIQADGSSAGWPPGSYFEVGAKKAQAVSQQDLSQLGISQTVMKKAAQLLATKLPEPRSRLIHGDASPANTILIDKSNLAVIDFDAVAWGDPAIDLAWWWYNSPGTAEEFGRGCAEVSEPTVERTLWLYRVRQLVGLADSEAGQDAELAPYIGGLLEQAVSSSS